MAQIQKLIDICRLTVVVETERNPKFQFQNLSLKFKTVPNYPVWQYSEFFLNNYKFSSFFQTFIKNA